MSFVNVQDRKLPFVFRYLGDLLTYRHLCWNLVGVNLRARFRRTRLGWLWAIIQPLGMAMMIAFVWSALDRSVNVWQFALYVAAGHAAFDLVNHSVFGGQDALLSAGGYLKQARVPFFIFQLRVLLSGLVFFLFEVVAVIGFAVAIGEFPMPGQHLLLLPAYVVMAGLFCCPIVILFSIWGAQYRDLRHASGLLMRALFLLSPVMLPRSVLELPHLRFLEVVNPLVPLLDMFRDPVIYGQLWQLQDVTVLSIWTAALWMIALVSAASAGRKVIFAL
jgi:lipopolysaccharide transport system permease protein